MHPQDALNFLEHAENCIKTQFIIVIIKFIADSTAISYRLSVTIPSEEGSLNFGYALVVILHHAMATENTSF